MTEPYPIFIFAQSLWNSPYRFRCLEVVSVERLLKRCCLGRFYNSGFWWLWARLIMEWAMTTLIYLIYPLSDDIPRFNSLFYRFVQRNMSGVQKVRTRLFIFHEYPLYSWLFIQMLVLLITTYRRQLREVFFSVSPRTAGSVWVIVQGEFLIDFVGERANAVCTLINKMFDYINLFFNLNSFCYCLIL